MASQIALPLELSDLAEDSDYLFNCAATVMQPISQHKWVSATLGWAGFKSQRKAVREAEEALIFLRIKRTSPSRSWVVHNIGFHENPLNQPDIVRYQPIMEVSVRTRLLIVKLPFSCCVWVFLLTLWIGTHQNPCG